MFFPPKKRSKPSKKATKIPVITKVQDDRSTGGYREVCNKPAWEIRRKEAWLRDGCRCLRCGKWVPLHQKPSLVQMPDGEQYATFTAAANIHHKRDRGLGGSRRDDRLENLETHCKDCHEDEHETRRKGKPKCPNP